MMVKVSESQPFKKHMLLMDDTCCTGPVMSVKAPWDRGINYQPQLTDFKHKHMSSPQMVFFFCSGTFVHFRMVCTKKIGKARSFPKFLADGSCCTRVDIEKS